MMLRLLELIFFLYFLTHIPVTVLFDSQILADEIGIPKDLYPEEVCFIHFSWGPIGAFGSIKQNIMYPIPNLSKQPGNFSHMW